MGTVAGDRDPNGPVVGLGGQDIDQLEPVRVAGECPGIEHGTSIGLDQGHGSARSARPALKAFRSTWRTRVKRYKSRIGTP
jgi:hypothetical protein